MIDKDYIASPLLEHVFDETDCFSNSSPEYSELLGRLLIIQAHLKATESALKVIKRIALKGSNETHALQRIYQVSSEYLGAAECGEQMLGDINTSLEYLHWPKPPHQLADEPMTATDEELDELLGKLTRTNPVAPPEQ